MSLNSNQISTVNKILGTNSFCSAVVRLYTTTGDDWRFTGIIGVATISKKNGFSTISLIDLDNQTELFSEELYYNFNYQTPKPYFHHFEVADCVAGFSFADDSEAINFSNQVNNNKPTKSQPQMNTPPPINTPPPQQNLTPIQQPPKSNSNPQPPSSQDKKNTKKGGGGGFFSKLFGGGSKKEEVVHEISSPTNFRHESHIGWDPVNGFDIKNIPPAWKELFKKAGVKKSDLQDKETAKLVMETIVDNIGGPPENTPPPPTMTGNNPPPPPPPINNTGGGGGDNVPPPPMPPPPPTFDGPPPPKFDGPPPPKPPPPMQTNNNSGGGGGTNAPMSFAEQLKMKQTSGLKTVEKVENLPQLPEDTGTLANALASALKNRRGAIEDERDSDDNNSGDEWSD